jgi:hypothetical protein
MFIHKVTPAPSRYCLDFPADVPLLTLVVKIIY